MKRTCGNCAKKVGLFGIKCRCQKVFCSICIYTKIKDSDIGHFCTFDYKQLEHNNLKQSVKAVKIDII